jgi:hypothetical protein
MYEIQVGSAGVAPHARLTLSPTPLTTIKLEPQRKLPRLSTAGEIAEMLQAALTR